ncbi:MAG TPA: regulatory protein RecX [Candidatus Aminicenantes bacterium]|nr:regulatory protein RecX [Candidatus Aminicenantes bacterium]
MPRIEPTEFTPGQRAACARAAAVCSRTEICASDVLGRLKGWGLTEEEARPVVDYLEDHGFIDDERFARAYVRDKFRFNGWGKRKISFMLQAKGIGPEVQSIALAEIDDQASAGRLRQLLTVKAQSVRARDRHDLRQKLMRFGLGRGFAMEEIATVLAEIGI